MFSGWALMQSIPQQITKHMQRADGKSRTDMALYFGHNCTSGWLWPKPDTSHQSSDTLEGCSKSGRSKREEVKHSFYTAFTHTDRCCLLWSIFSQSAPICGPLSGKPLRTCCLSYAQWHRTVEPCMRRASDGEGGRVIGIHSNQQRP